ncbi:MAG: carbon-nitrogen hydrolase [Chlorobiales bacterium]|nr:carbon-nitrogen hydrolase [Chlorobiales bacterium]
MKIALVQMACEADPEANLKRACEKIVQSALQGAKIVCLQELFTTLYFCQEEDYAPFELSEAVPGPSTDMLRAIAAEHEIVVVASLFEKRTSGLYHNTAVVIDADGSYLGKYRKMHIPDDPGFYEKFYFTPGDLGYKVFKTRYAAIGVLICWDQWYPEAARLTALQGAEILFYPTAIGWTSSEGSDEVRQAQLQAWKTVQQGHAIANGVFIAAVNRVGTEGELRFWGNSFVSDPFGQITAAAHESNEEILLEDCDVGKIAYYRTHWPFLRDRRIETYGDIQRRYID